MGATSSSLRIVLATFGSPGDLRPFLSIGGELRRQRHEVVVATSPFYADTVRAAGFAFAPVRPDRQPGQQDPDFFARLVRERRPPSSLFRDMFLPSLRESTADMLPVVGEADAVVAHPLAASARLAAEVRGTPWVSAVMQPMGFLSAFEPPVVGPGWISRVLRAAGPRPTSQALRIARFVTDAWAADWRTIRAELRLPSSAAHPLWEGQHAPRRALGLFPRALGAPQRDWPKQARVTGFPFHVDFGEELDPVLERFLAVGPPPVVFTLGTTAVNDPGRFYDESGEAVQELGCRAVLIVGDAPFRATREGDRIHVIPYAPHRLLFPRAAAIVHQGGIGTLAEAMRAGKPMLIAPYAHDQADNAWRAGRIGISRTVPRRRYRAGVVARELRRLLEHESIRDAALVTALQVALERGAAEAADLIVAALRPERGEQTAPRDRRPYT